MDLTCERVREVLWPLDRPRSHVPEEEAARDHLTACDGCRAFFLRDAEIASMLQRLGEGMEIRPTPGLRLSVAKALAKTGKVNVPRDSAAVLLEIPAEPASRSWRRIAAGD